MLTDYFSASFALTRHRGTPFGGYLDGFTEWLAEQGYKDEKIRVAVQNVTALGVWLPDDVASQMLDEDVLGRYDVHLRRIGRFKHASGRYFSFSTGARLFLKYLRTIAVAPPPRVELSPIVEEFGGWLRTHRGAAPGTIENYTKCAQVMVEALGDPRRTTPAALRAYLLRKADGRSRSYVKNLCAAVRGFLRFLIATGRCRVGLDGAVPVIARWRLAELPRFIQRADVRRIVAAPDQQTAHGLRDRAILTIVADMGLRAGDVGAITLDAIDWKARSLTVVGKGKVATRLPMPPSVARAVRAYLDRGRPEVNAPRCSLAWPRPIGRSGARACSTSCARRSVAPVWKHRTMALICCGTPSPWTYCAVVFLSTRLVRAFGTVRSTRR